MLFVRLETLQAAASSRVCAAPRWVCAARALQARRRKVALAAAGVRSAAAAADAADGPSSSSPRGSPPQQHAAGRRGREPAPAAPWTYKYQHFACSSPVHPEDRRCMEVEALFQNVLGFPRLPERLYTFLQRFSDLTVDQVTATVEGLDARYGKELVLYMLRRTPWILQYSVEEMESNIEAVRAMLDLKGCDVFTIMRKNPPLLIMDAPTVRTRYNNLHRVLPLGHDEVKALVRKCPLVLNKATENIARAVERLRHMAYTRAIWQQDFEVITPSLLAFYIKDHEDLLLRLEFLALTGDSATWNLHQVFKPSNNTFQKKHAGFREWVKKRQARRQMMQLRAEQRAQGRLGGQQQQQHLQDSREAQR